MIKNNLGKNLLHIIIKINIIIIVRAITILITSNCYHIIVYRL